VTSPQPLKGSGVKAKSWWATLSGGSALAVAVVAGPPLTAPSAAATPPPTPPPLSAPATPPPGATAEPAAGSTPIPIPSGYGFPGVTNPAPGGSASPSPPPDARKGLEGVWELQIQHGSRTDYAHFKLVQTGTTLTGTYVDNAGKKSPLAGSVDGQSVRLVVTLADGTSLLLEGRLDGTTDMEGLLTSAQDQVGFTAAYRPKEKFMDNLNAAPGGLGGMGQGGGGYSPPR
jgi:hypothetical protein